MSLQQSIHLPSPQGLLFFEKNEHPAHDKLSHLLMPQVREDAGRQAPRAHEGTLYPFYTPSDPLVLDEEVLVSPMHPLEWRRRCQQARLLVQHFRTPLPEQGEAFQIKRVLELGTDPHGEALRQLASLRPTTEIIGVTSQAIYARQAAFFAAVQGYRNVSLQVCPLTRPLPFPAESMDLISGRFLHATLPEYAWPLLLDDCFRLLRPGGVLRLLECVQGASTSAAAGTRWAGCERRLVHRSQEHEQCASLDLNASPPGWRREVLSLLSNTRACSTSLPEHPFIARSVSRPMTSISSRRHSAPAMVGHLLARPINRSTTTCNWSSSNPPFVGPGTSAPSGATSPRDAYHERSPPCR